MAVIVDLRAVAGQLGDLRGRTAASGWVLPLGDARTRNCGGWSGGARRTEPEAPNRNRRRLCEMRYCSIHCPGILSCRFCRRSFLGRRGSECRPRRGSDDLGDADRELTHLMDSTGRSWFGKRTGGLHLMGRLPARSPVCL